MRLTPAIVTTACLLRMLTIRSVGGHAIDEPNHRVEEHYDKHPNWKEPRAVKSESVLMGIAKSLIGGKIGATGGQNHHCVHQDVNKRSALGYCKLSSLTALSGPCTFFKMASGLCGLPEILSLSLNMSNIMLMLVLRGLIWGVSYMQGGGKEARDEDATSAGGLLEGAITETDVMLFLGYLVADESGNPDCLNRVACEQPDRVYGYLRAAETVWQTAKMFDGVIPLDVKYETILEGLQEAVEDGRADADCTSKYKCFESNTNDEADRFNLT